MSILDSCPLRWLPEAPGEFHSGINVWGSLIALHPSETGEPISAVAITGPQVLLAVVLVVAVGAPTLSRGAGGGTSPSDT
jgi:hypothetical protein